MNPEALSESHRKRLDARPSRARVHGGVNLRAPSAARVAWLFPLLTACTAGPSRPAVSSPSANAASATAQASSGSTPPPTGTGSGISRTLLDQADLPDSPGWETRLFLIEYAPGATAPKHHHPVSGVGYVISGSFESAFEGEKPKIVREGESFRDAAQTSHVLFRNVDGSKPLKFVILYVVRKGEPVLVTP